MKSSYRLTGSNSGKKEPTRFDSDVSYLRLIFFIILTIYFV